MSARGKKIWQRVGVYFLALSIPVFLGLAAVQSRHYSQIEREVDELEERQNDLIESNKAYVTDISVLGSSERIEKVATEELGMRKADADEIVRVTIEGKK